MPGSAPSTYLPSLLFTSGDSCPKIFKKGNAKSSCPNSPRPLPASASNKFVDKAPASSFFTTSSFMFIVSLLFWFGFLRTR